MSKFEKWDEQLKWFTDRIGKVVWRNKTSCDCAVCKNVYEKGVVITSKFHANYLCDLIGDYAADGTVLEYFDTKEERDQFESNPSLV